MLDDVFMTLTWMFFYGHSCWGGTYYNVFNASCTFFPTNTFFIIAISAVTVECAKRRTRFSRRDMTNWSCLIQQRCKMTQDSEVVFEKKRIGDSRRE